MVLRSHWRKNELLPSKFSDVLPPEHKTFNVKFAAIPSPGRGYSECGVEQSA